MRVIPTVARRWIPIQVHRLHRSAIALQKLIKEEVQRVAFVALITESWDSLRGVVGFRVRATQQEV